MKTNIWFSWSVSSIWIANYRIRRYSFWNSVMKNGMLNSGWFSLKTKDKRKCYRRWGWCNIWKIIYHNVNHFIVITANDHVILWIIICSLVLKGVTRWLKMLVNQSRPPWLMIFVREGGLHAFHRYMYIPGQTYLN